MYRTFVIALSFQPGSAADFQTAVPDAGILLCRGEALPKGALSLKVPILRLFLRVRRMRFVTNFRSRYFGHDIECGDARATMRRSLRAAQSRPDEVDAKRALWPNWLSSRT